MLLTWRAANGKGVSGKGIVPLLVCMGDLRGCSWSRGVETLAVTCYVGQQSSSNAVSKEYSHSSENRTVAFSGCVDYIDAGECHRKKR